MGIADFMWQSAAVDAAVQSGDDPTAALAAARQQTASIWDGTVLPYVNTEQKLGGVFGEVASPAAYAKAAQLTGAGIGLLRGLSATDIPSEIAGVGDVVATDPLRGPVVFKAPPNSTPEQIAQFQAYVDGSNEALAAGYISPTGRVSTSGSLRIDASLSAAEERAAAAEAGTPYQGQAGHVPDTTWTGRPDPYSWLDLDPSVNASLGGQARWYPIGYKPTKFILGQ